MKKMSKLVLALGSLFCLSAVNAGVPNHDNPTTFVGPTARGSFTTPFTDSTAVSVSGEAGVKNFRVGGTVGWRIDPVQRVKLSIEWLWQDITYSFFSGNTDQWVNQGAIGGDYEYLLTNYPFQPTFDLSAWYSHADSKSLSTRTGRFITRFGQPVIFFDQRRIAGSNAGGAAPGVTVTPWLGARFGLALNYDNVSYNTRFRGRNANGFGGTAHFNQLILENVGVGAMAAVRQPFNNYGANLYWSNVPFYGTWTLGLFGDYTTGKQRLPNTWDVGISADYFFLPCPPVVSANLKGDLKGEVPPAPIKDDFISWTADPGVYIPQVLAITDPRVTFFEPVQPPVVVPPVEPPAVCTPVPTVIGTIPNTTVPAGGTSTINASLAFNPPAGSGLVYTLALSTSPTGGNTVTINPTTGVITAHASGASAQTITGTVTATNPCGNAAVSTAFTLQLQTIG